MPPDTDELRVSDLMKAENAPVSSDWKAFYPKNYYQKSKNQFSIFKKLYPLNRKKILLYPLLFILILSIYQAFMIYSQKGMLELKVFFEKKEISKSLDHLSLTSMGATFESEKKSNDNSLRIYQVKLASEVNPERFIATFENKVRTDYLKNQEYEKDFLLKQVETIRAKIHQHRIAGSPEFLQMRADHDIHAYLLHGEESLKKRVEYYHKILYIDDFARHNVLEVFHLRKKELEIPLLKELENLSAFIQKESPEAVKELIGRIKVKHDEYLDELMQREMEDIPDKYLIPARKELLQEEKKLRILFHDWKMSDSLFQAYRDKLNKNKTDTLDKLYIQSDLRLAENLMRKVEVIDLESFESQTPVKVVMTPISAKGVKAIEILLYTMLFLMFYFLMWFRMIRVEKNFPTINSVEELEDRLKLSVAHQISFEDLAFEIENLELNSFYQQVGAYYSQAKNIVGKTEMILFHSSEVTFSTKELAYLYTFGIAAGSGRVCLVDTTQDGKWNLFGQLDRSFSNGLLDMLNGKCDLKDSVYGTEYRNLFVSPLNTEQRISKSKTDLNAGAQWDSKFDKIVFAINNLLVDDVLDFFKTHRVVIYYLVNSGDQLHNIEKDIRAFREKNAEVKIIFKK